MTIFGFTFNAYAIIALVLLVGFIILIYRANADPKTDFDWMDLVTAVDQQTGKVQASATKLLQLIGGATGTFIVIKLTLQNNITFDIFSIYLAYVASIDGFSRFMLAKYGVTKVNQDSQDHS